jgi:hypothetical protein
LQNLFQSFAWAPAFQLVPLPSSLSAVVLALASVVALAVPLRVVAIAFVLAVEPGQKEREH